MKALNVQDVYLRVQFLYEVQEALHALPSTGPGNCAGALPVENEVFGYAGGKILETSPLEVLVVPNPDGIKQSPPRGNNNLQFNFGNPFDFDFSFPDMRDMPQQTPPAPRQEAPVEQKKKRKTTRI